MLSKLSKKIKKMEKAPISTNISGLYYIEDFITKEEATFLISEINKKSWNLSLKRRTQHYGYSYDYKSSHLDLSTKTEPFPEFVNFLLHFQTNASNH